MENNNFAFGVRDAEQGADESLVVPNTAFPGFSNIPTFDIRNGDPSEATSILVRPTIESGFHWAPVGGVTHVNALNCIEGFIRCAYAQSFSSTVGNPSEAKRKKLAIVLGTARAVMTCYYRLTSTDIIGGELGSVRLNAVVAANGTVSYTCPLAQNDQNRARVTADMNFDDAEKAVISQLVLSSIGIPALQGWSLGMTGHHYISENSSQSRRAYKTVEQQFWKGQTVSAWFNADITDITDWLWHKSGHPISLTLKAAWAENEGVAEMIKRAGAGSAAARLPLLESPLRAASTYQTLMETVHVLLSQVGGEMSPGPLPDIIYYTKTWPKGAPRLNTPEFNAIFDASITSRQNAVDWLAELLNRNKGKVAWAYGFYNGLSEANQMASGANNTLKQANSLEKLRNESLAAYTEGFLAYSDYMAKKQSLRMAGKFEAPKHKFAA
jgi:hypothetical protein